MDTKGGERPYTSTGTFKTLASTGLIPALPGDAVPAGLRRFDAIGRKLEAQGKPGEGVIFTNRMAKPAYR